MRGAEKKRLQARVERSKSCEATVAAGFQRTFPVCEAVRGPSWQVQGAGAMPAPYCFQRGESPRPNHSNWWTAHNWRRCFAGCKPRSNRRWCRSRSEQVGSRLRGLLAVWRPVASLERQFLTNRVTGRTGRGKAGWNRRAARRTQPVRLSKASVCGRLSPPKLLIGSHDGLCHSLTGDVGHGRE